MGFLMTLAVLAGAAQEDDDDYRFSRSVYWFSSVDQVTGAERGRRGEEEGRRRRRGNPRRYVLVYVRPIHEEREPNLFSDQTLVRRSYDDWAFLKVDLDSSDPRLKEWGIRRAPMIAGLDLHGNEFLKTSSVSISAVRSLMKALPTAIARYEARLRQDFSKAKSLLASDTARGIGALRDVVAKGKRGYDEVAEAGSLIDDHAADTFRHVELAESVSPEAAFDYLGGLAKLYRGTEHGVRAELRIARLERDLGREKEAEQRLKKLLKLEGPGLESSLEGVRSLLLQLGAIRK